MSENSKIEWTDRTFNPVRGCTKVSPACDHCYAETLSLRNPSVLGKWGPRGTRVVAVQAAWNQLERWNREVVFTCPGCNQTCFREPVPDGEFVCADCEMVPIQRRARVFCASLGDVFEEWKGLMSYPEERGERGTQIAWWSPDKGLIKAGQTTPRNSRGERPATMQDMRDQLWRAIEATPNLIWQLLTKRPQNVLRMVPEDWRAAFPENVWIGTTVEDQKRADQRIPDLLQIPARVRFLSCEPLLGPIEFSDVSHRRDAVQRLGKSALDGIHWIIAGGESGPDARPMHPDWARSLRDQAAACQVPFLFKQWGEFLGGKFIGGGRVIAQEFDGDLPDRIPACHEWGDGAASLRVGKKAAGRLLDGVEHDQFPQCA